MIDDELERRVLGRMKSALSPSRADGERVRGAIARRIALGPLAMPNDERSAEMPDGALDAVAGVTRRWLSWLGVGVAVASGSAAGYYVGHSAGVQVGRRETGERTTQFSEPVRSETQKASEVPLPPAPAPVAPVLEAAPSRPPAVAQRALPPTAGNDAGLDEEVRLLKRVERALRDRNPRYALGLLGELERTVPGGQLVEERQAAKVMARCQLEGGSEALADEFAKKHPESTYVTRVQETCRQKNEQRIVEEAETNRLGDQNR